MTNILLWIIGGYLLTLITWTFYLAVMKLKWAMDRGLVGQFAKVNGYILIIIGLVPYVLFNWTVATIMFLQLPRLRKIGYVWKIPIILPEPQFTMRCKWNIKYGKGWRKRQAEYWCKHMLDPFEEGGHC